MATNQSITDSYGALLTSTFRNMGKDIYDAITTSNKLIFMLMRKGGNGYRRSTTLGYEKLAPLMYDIGIADSYNSYDELNVDPIDGATVSRWQWRQMAVPIAISGREKRLNRGDAQIINLLDLKKTQAKMGAIEYCNRSILQGNGGTAIQTPATSATNGSVFVDPLPRLVAYDPTASLTVGGLDQSTAVNTKGQTYWRNQTFNSVSTTGAGFLKETRNLYNLCSKGGGDNGQGPPNFHIVDQGTYELYEFALSLYHRNTSYERADIPFDNIKFRGQPMVWDEFTPDVQGGSATQSTTSGTWWMLNLDFMEFEVDAETDFVTTDFKRVDDAYFAHILWFGALGVMNRRKLGVMGGIDTTIAA